ncbi:MAG: outer membrane beta-barrel protein [Planctomycetota bacterium]|jgi:opacity protein-like surface antigen|nr:outer membrane beta-barrel protein [Planctomycetota bacterium]
MLIPLRGLLCPCALLLASSLPLSRAAAQDSASTFSYTYLNITYSMEDVDGFDDDAVGITLDGAIRISDSLHLVGGYGDGEIEAFGTALSLDTYSIGVGYNSPLSDRADLYVRARYIDVEAEALGASASEDGFGFSAGVRFMVAERVELGAALQHLDLGDGDTGFGVGALFYPSERIGLGASLTAFDESTAVAVGLRFQL